jgi:glyoxylase I family protein
MTPIPRLAFMGYRDSWRIAINSTAMNRLPLVGLIAAALMTNAANPPIPTTKPTLDVGIIVSDIANSKAFYGGVLGLKETAPLPMPDGTSMIRYQAGTAILKLREFPKAAKFLGGTRTAVGFRLLTIYFPDLAPVLKRWKESGGGELKITDGITKGSKYTLLTDPDGNQIEIVGMPPEIDVVALDKIAVGLTVASVERSREFYGTVLGLAEDSPLPLAGGGTEYRFMSGKTQIKFWAGAPELPVRTGAITDALGFRYFTFMVSDVDAVAAQLKSRGVNIVLPPTDFGRIARIMMISDPDGNWIEFAAPKRATREGVKP